MTSTPSQEATHDHNWYWHRSAYYPQMDAWYCRVEGCDVRTDELPTNTSTPSQEAVAVLDWTADEDGRANSSHEFLRIVDEVACLLLNSAHSLISGHTEHVARLIMAQLAHKHGLAPQPSNQPQDSLDAALRALEGASRRYHNSANHGSPWRVCISDVCEYDRALAEQLRDIERQARALLATPSPQEEK